MHRKTATCLGAFTHVNSEDKPAPSKLREATKTNFNDREMRSTDTGTANGGNQDAPQMSSKFEARIAKLEKAKGKELAHRVGRTFILYNADQIKSPVVNFIKKINKVNK